MFSYRLLLLVLVPACGQPKQNEPKHTVERAEAVEVYVARFEQEWGKQVEIGIILTSLPEPVQGRCTKYSSGYRDIEIDADYLDKASDLQVEQLIFHELAHCLLNLKHDDRRMTNGMPVSIMNHELFDHRELQYYKQYREYYMNQLFNRK